MSAAAKDFPRRNRLDLMSPAELAITTAMGAVEEAGADVRLTEAVNLLGQARDKVADVVNGIPFIPTVPGTPFAGGFYAGRIAHDGQTYALIVAPKAEGEHSGIVWKTDWRAATPGTQSLIDGFANTEAMNDDGHPAAQWARSLRVAGLDDWYLPARDELEVIYRNLKPTPDDNWTYPSRLARYGAKPGQYNGVDEHGNGHNASSVPPGASYIETSPSQTTAEAFQEGGPEAFERAWYWSSTEFYPATAWLQYFVDGVQVDGGKYGVLQARAVRKVLLSTSPIPLSV